MRDPIKIIKTIRLTEKGTALSEKFNRYVFKVDDRATKLEIKNLTRVFDREVTGVYISDMVSDVIANARAGNLLVTVQVHANALAAANLVDICGIVVAQGKLPAEDVLKMAERHEISIFTTDLNRWQLATRLYEAGVR